MIEEEEKVTISVRIFPLPKTDEKRGIRREKIIFFIASPKFASNMASQEETILSKHLTHTITEHFGNSSILLKLIGRLGNFDRTPRINQLSGLGLMPTSPSSILHHFLLLIM